MNFSNFRIFNSFYKLIKQALHAGITNKNLQKHLNYTDKTILYHIIIIYS